MLLKDVWGNNMIGNSYYLIGFLIAAGATCVAVLLPSMEHLISWLLLLHASLAIGIMLTALIVPQYCVRGLLRTIVFTASFRLITMITAAQIPIRLEVYEIQKKIGIFIPQNNPFVSIGALCVIIVALGWAFPKFLLLFTHAAARFAADAVPGRELGIEVRRESGTLSDGSAAELSGRLRESSRLIRLIHEKAQMLVLEIRLALLVQALGLAIGVVRGFGDTSLLFSNLPPFVVLSLLIFSPFWILGLTLRLLVSSEMRRLLEGDSR